LVRHLKVSDEVYEQVLRLQGFLQARDGKRYTVDEVIRDLLTIAADAGIFSIKIPSKYYKIVQKEEAGEEGEEG